MSERSPKAVPSRVAPLPNLPLFHKLGGRKAVVVGSSEGATWKAELLEAAGANVIRLDSWTAHDLVGAALAIADLSDREEALRFVNHGVYNQQPREERVLPKSKSRNPIL